MMPLPAAPFRDVLKMLRSGFILQNSKTNPGPRHRTTRTTKEIEVIIESCEPCIVLHISKDIRNNLHKKVKVHNMVAFICALELLHLYDSIHTV